MGCEVLMVVIVEIVDVCDVTLFSPVEHYQCLRGTYYLSQQFPLKFVNILHTIISQKNIV
jgi:hypothetical protein